ncbi:MAG: hypothetical protein Q8J62_05835, partial [Candidatus Cloacimonadaceae bacterium]|nr:hypothetical protein [Candidatus Cloacimonadaceae bacterium]
GSSWQLNYGDWFSGAQIDNATADWFEGEISQTWRLISTIRFSAMAHNAFIIGHDTRWDPSPRHHIFAGWQLSY